MRIEEFYRQRNRSRNRAAEGGQQTFHQHTDHQWNSRQAQHFSTGSGAPLLSCPSGNGTVEKKQNSGTYFSQYLPIFRDKAMSATASNCAVDMQSQDSMDEESLLRPSGIEKLNYPDSYPMNKNSLPHNQQQSSSSQLTIVRFRQIQPKDRYQIQQLHEEWFPVEYQPEFYDDLCTHQRMCHSGHTLYTMVAVIPKEENSIPTENGDDNDVSDETIIACLVGCVLSAHKLNDDTRQLLIPDWPRRYNNLFYIMTLGTVSKYRHLGLATQMVKQVLESVVQRDPEMGTVYLHVITLNDAAIRFYENKLGFWKVQEIADYYTIEGKPYNCYLYARYFHGNRGHLNVFKVVSRWLTSLWSSLSHMLKSQGYLPAEERIQ